MATVAVNFKYLPAGIEVVDGDGNKYQLLETKAKQEGTSLIGYTSVERMSDGTVREISHRYEHNLQPTNEHVINAHILTAYTGSETTADDILSALLKAYNWRTSTEKKLEKLAERVRYYFAANTISNEQIGQLFRAFVVSKECVHGNV